MGALISAVALLGVLLLVGRRLPAARWPLVIAATLAVILLVVGVERAGLWPATWRVR